LGVARSAVAAELESWYFHDWQADPFARGAYSFVLAGGLDARAALAQPLDDTLFFAGEATNSDGHTATVHGAIASGRRAAREVIAHIARR
jgi:monoamine oxidase